MKSKRKSVIPINLKLVLILFFSSLTLTSQAQIDKWLKKKGKRIERQVTRKIDRKVDSKIDKTVDKTFDKKIKKKKKEADKGDSTKVDSTNIKENKVIPATKEVEKTDAKKDNKENDTVFLRKKQHQQYVFDTETRKLGERIVSFDFFLKKAQFSESIKSDRHTYS